MRGGVVRDARRRRRIPTKRAAIAQYTSSPITRPAEFGVIFGKIKKKIVYKGRKSRIYYAIAALFVGIRRLRRASLKTPPRTHSTPRGDTAPAAGLVMGLLEYYAIAALRGDTPPTVGMPNNSIPHTLHPPWGYAAFGGICY